MEHERVLVTGGSGLLGRTLKGMMPGADFLDSREFNLADRAGMERYLDSARPAVVLHAAAFTSPPAVDRDPLRAVRVNVAGTAHLVELCAARDIRLIYMSTDYVFNGERGNYREDDPVYPVNKYAWSKLGGECAVRLYDNSLIIRTSFGPNEFPYEKAFVDQWTSRESVDAIAAKVVELIARDHLRGTIHIGTRRQTVYEYARKLSPEKKIGELSITDVNFKAPRDTSLDCSRYEAEIGVQLGQGGQSP